MTRYVGPLSVWRALLFPKSSYVERWLSNTYMSEAWVERFWRSSERC